MTWSADLVSDAGATLGEGACWDDRTARLLWVDIAGRTLHVHDPRSRSDQIFAVGDRPGTVVLRRDGGLVLALGREVVLLDEPGGKPRTLCRIASEREGNRMNDGKCDPAGRLWVGSTSTRGEPECSSLYCVEPDGRYRTVLNGVTISNGIVWTADERTMYYIDSPTRAVQAFDYDRVAGRVAGRRVAFPVKRHPGLPDGMAIDAEGMVWIAFFGGAAVRRFDPGAGTLLDTVELPVTNVTSRAFGGDDLRDLYITTAREGLTAEVLADQPTAGGLYRARARVPGVLQHRFAG